MPTALLFDLDGTLIDSAPGVAAALAALAHARQPAPGALPGGSSCAAPGAVPLIDAARVRPLISLGAGALVAQALGPLAGDPAADLADFRSLLARQSHLSAPLYPGAAAALRGLAGRGVPMAICTNKPAALAARLLEGWGLAGLFGALVGGDSLGGIAKPDPAPLRAAMARLGAGQAVMVGDSIVDARAAAAAGMDFWLFAKGYGAQDPALAGVPCAARFDHHGDVPGLWLRRNAGAALGENAPIFRSMAKEAGPVPLVKTLGFRQGQAQGDAR